MIIKIFLFHRVSPVRDLLWDPMDPSRFERVIAFIKKKYEVIQLESFLLNNDPAKKTKKSLAAIVFDDGYKDFIEYALPILKKHACPCSMYVITDCVTRQIPPWTYILDYHFSKSKKLEMRFDDALLPGALHIRSFPGLDARIAFAKKFKPYLKTIPDAKRRELYRQAIASLDDVQVPGNLMMNWNELKQIKSEGVEIGSHTVTHPLLAKIESESVIISEIKGSGEVISQQLGHFPVTISYPVGSYNETVKKIAAESGYKIGLAVNQDFYDTQKNGIFEIPRTELYNEPGLKTKLRISGTIRQINKLMRK